jgi:hypothetical protein
MKKETELPGVDPEQYEGNLETEPDVLAYWGSTACAGMAARIDSSPARKPG